MLLFLIVAIGIFCYLNVNYNIGIPCTWYTMYGLYCPGCGMTRATVSLLHFDFYQAFRYNAFSVIAIPIVILYIIGGIYAWLFNKTNFMYNKIPAVVWIIFLVAMLLYGVLRNFEMFSYLAPMTI